MKGTTLHRNFKNKVRINCNKLRFNMICDPCMQTTENIFYVIFRDQPNFFRKDFQIKIFLSLKSSIIYIYIYIYIYI
jgi:hypothetical protein